MDSGLKAFRHFASCTGMSADSKGRGYLLSKEITLGASPHWEYAKHMERMARDQPRFELAKQGILNSLSHEIHLMTPTMEM